MPIEAAQQVLIDDLNFLPDPHERLSALVSKYQKSTLPPEAKTDANRVHGCISQVWLTAESIDGIYTFRCDAESPMVKALVALVCDLYTGGTATEIQAMEPRIWKECGLLKVLSPTRLNGLQAVRQRILNLIDTTIA